MIQKTLQRTIEHYKLLSPNQMLILGVSGGTDSLALMHSFLHLREKLPIQIHVATFDHGIRGQMADDDVRFVEHLAVKWDLPYTIGRGDVPQYARDNRYSLEMASRRLRYDFLAEVAKVQGANTVAVAHHADDQAETILMHIIRGSGLTGLRGMQVSSPMPYHPNFTLIRPLLTVTREELEQYCREHQLEPRHDATNDNADYHRNRIRHQLIPLLRDMNPAVVESLGRLADSVTVDDSYLKEELQNILLHHTKMEEQRWFLYREIFLDTHESLQRRFIIHAFQTLNQSDASISQVNVLRAVQVAQDGQVGALVELGGGIRLRLGYKGLFIEKENLPLDEDDFRLIPKNSEVNINIPHHLSVGKIHIKVSDDKPEHEPFVLMLRKGVKLKLRTRRAGDKFSPKGMGGHSRRLKEWMIDRKIPRHIRDMIPLVEADGEIVAICIGDTWHFAEFSQRIDNSTLSLYLTLT